jgi:hypothetical protein
MISRHVRAGRSVAVAIAALVVVALVSCGGALAEGESDFKSGRYPEAKEIFAGLELEAKGYGDAKRAEYALYRGLTLGALGDRARAGGWLREAKAIEAAHPGSLSQSDARRMNVAIEAIEEP